MNIKELTFCSATLIMNCDKEKICKLVDKHKLQESSDINSHKSMFFNMQDLLKLKEKEKLFKIIFELITVEGEILNKNFPNNESLLDEKKLKNYLFKNDVELKYISLCYHFLKLNNFKNYEMSGELGELFSDLYIILVNKILQESYRALVNCHNENNPINSLDVDFEKMSKKLYNELKTVKDNNLLLSSENKKLTKTNKTQLKQINNLNKEVIDTKKYIEEIIIKTIGDNNNELIKAFKNTKYDVLENTYNSTLDKLTEELSLARADSRSLSQRLAFLTKENRDLKEKIKYCEAKTEITPSIVEEKEEMQEEVKNKKLYNNYLKDVFIVWCKDVENMIGVKSDGSKVTIKDIPPITYIAKGDFMLVREDGKFLRSLDGFTEKNIYPNIEFAVVTVKNDIFYASKCITGEMIQINLDTMRTPPKENMVVGLDINNNHNVKIIFKRSVHLLNSYRTIIDMKKQRVLYILKTLNKGYLVRDCFTDSEEFNDTHIEQVNKGDVIIVDENNEYLGDLSPMMYLHSPLNTHKNYYTLSIENSNVYGVHQNGVTTLLNNPSDLVVEDKNLAVVDEFNNILYLVDYNTREQLPSKYKK